MKPISVVSAAVFLMASSAVGCLSSKEVEAPEPTGGGKNDSGGSATTSCDAAKNGDHFEFLDDACHKKFAPSALNRDWSCPNVAADPGNYAPSSKPITVDAAALKGVIPDDTRMTVVMIKRVKGVPYYRYLSNGTHDIPVEPLSSTKFMAAANGAARIRAASGGKIGLDASVDGVPLGDLITVITTYQESQYLSNGLARYFHDVGGRNNANALIHNWLKRPAAETFGGNYFNESSPLGFTFKNSTGSVSVNPDYSGSYNNNLSTLTMAEFTKRLAMHREDAATRMPGLQWKDVEILFYGAEKTKLFQGQALGGMAADTAIYVQEGINMAALEQRSRGQWRIFSKLGWGPSGFVHNSYTCAPSLDSNGTPIAGDGVEFVISMKSPKKDSDRDQDAAVAAVFRNVVGKIIEHKIQ